MFPKHAAHHLHKVCLTRVKRHRLHSNNRCPNFCSYKIKCLIKIQPKFFLKNLCFSQKVAQRYSWEPIFDPPHDDLCNLERLRSAWALTQSESAWNLTATAKTDKTGRIDAQTECMCFVSKCLICWSIPILCSYVTLTFMARVYYAPAMTWPVFWVSVCMYVRTSVCKYVRYINERLSLSQIAMPQGSVLGPLLFLVYINDIAKQLLSLTRLFADDCSLFYAAANIADIAGIINHDLQLVSNWAKQWLIR